MGDDERRSETTEEEFTVGPNQEYTRIDGMLKVGYVYHDSNEYKEGLRTGMSVTSKGPLLRKIKVIDGEDPERKETTFFAGSDQEYYNSDVNLHLGPVSPENFEKGLRHGMIVTSVGPLLRRITVITHINGEQQGSDNSYGGGGKRKKRKYSKKSTKRKYKKKGSKKRRKSKKKTKRRR